MALRVLLADESSTIKKVFQLALQDFAVEVRPVNIGVDVAMVATAFKPDIIFADVLLQKKNGYDVCAELKADAKLKSIPIVLMWSGFMELDEDKFQAAQANAQLEKPFDVAALRKLVTDLVPRTQNQRLSQFLSFPKTQAEADKRAQEPAADTPPPLKSEEDFTQVPMPKLKGTDKYRLDLKPEELDPSHIAVDYKADAQEIEVDENDSEDFTMRPPQRHTPAPSKTNTTHENSTVRAVELDMDADELVADEVEHLPIAPARSPSENRTAPPTLSLSPEELEVIIRQQSSEVIESVVWKVIPELAREIIERELHKLLQERDSHP